MKYGHVKDFFNFINESDGPHEYGCVMLNLEIPNWKSDVLSRIKEEDVYEGEDGLEDEPHVTVLYGLHNDIPDEKIEKKIKEEMTSPEIKLQKISIFENDEYDVVKFDVEGEELFRMNEEFSKFPHTTDYPDYHPHVTIGFVKKGEGKKYTGSLDEAIVVNPSKVKYSKADGSKHYYDFKK